MFTGNQQKKSRALSPGDVAPRSGTYLVTHSSHRLSHFVLVMEGTVLPPCNTCGSDVRFALHRRANYIQSDRDFEPAKDETRGQAA